MKLKTKLSKLRHDGHITDAEYSIITNALNRKPKERVISEIKIDEDTLRKLVKDKVDELTTKFATQPCEDAISRAEVINEIDRYIDKTQSTGTRDDLISFQELVVKQLPPVTPQQKVGKWIVHPKGGYAHLVCSKCLSDAPFDCKTNFCPNCGCRMIEPQESECDD